MELTSTAPTPHSVGQAVFPTAGELPLIEPTVDAGVETAPKQKPRRGYGMPCAKCRTYYAADLKSCPVCKSTERVSPRPADAPRHQPVEALPDPARLEEERERFLREFQSQLPQMQMPPVQLNASMTYRCSQEQNHVAGFEQAAVCQGCYDHLQERVDQMEASLHIDAKEAAQIVYDAVWADPSDPTRTYQNAAQALLSELRRRAGIKLVLGRLQPLPD